ncbi:putative peptidase S10, serine carboxypeptidase, alpha/Beta hydrolase [Rosa chinensis]|uniref:Putative peptidase S10, serine carboxypeptidase, alpha/Beta hydrolase n=1 Tax=Rosa chinensis TaxID=74649 RepID=A0A2P6PL29_ROSCH|nr:putative peptidase S10, serine carboxypeptidase, alpha/Beta hydrolase [Rosa chinensis]
MLILGSNIGTDIDVDENYRSLKTNCKGEYVNVDPNNALCVDDLDQYNEVSGKKLKVLVCASNVGMWDQEVLTLHLNMQCIADINTPQILEPYCTVSSPNPLGSEWDSDDLNQDSVNLLSLPQLSRPWCRGSIKDWQRCNKTLSASYISDVSSSLVYHQNLIKKSYRVLIYRCIEYIILRRTICSILNYFQFASTINLSVNSGDHDMVVPYLGTIAWIESLNLTVDSSWKPWFVNGQIAGEGVTQLQSTNLKNVLL